MEKKSKKPNTKKREKNVRRCQEEEKGKKCQNYCSKKKKIPGQFQEQFFLMDLNNCTSDVSESLYDHFRGALSYSYDLLKYDTNYKVMIQSAQTFKKQNFNKT